MSVCKEGTLKIKLHHQTKWHRRYCIIDWDKSILFIASRADSRYRDWIKLLPDTIINEYDHLSANECNNNGSSSSSNSSFVHTIEIKTDKDTINHLLQTETKIDFDAWLLALKRTAYSRIGGGIFGQSLDETYKYSRDKNSLIPLIIRECCDYLLEYGLTFVGLFRVPGKQSSIKELRDRYDRGVTTELNTTHSPATVSSLLKIYLQSLPEPIIPISSFDDCLAIGSKFKYNNKTEDLNNLKQLIETNLSNINYAVLAYLCLFLKKLTDHAEVTKMDTENLALAFGNNLIRPGEELDLNMIRGHNYNLVPLLKVLIDYSDYLFPLSSCQDTSEHSTTKSSGFSSFSSLLSTTNENSLPKTSRSSSLPSLYMATGSLNENELDVNCQLISDLNNQKKRCPSTDLLDDNSNNHRNDDVDQTTKNDVQSRPTIIRKMEKYPNRKSFANKFGRSLNSIKSSMSKALQSHESASSSSSVITTNENSADELIRNLQSQIEYFKDLVNRKDLRISELTKQSTEYQKNLEQLTRKVRSLENENVQLNKQLNMQ